MACGLQALKHFKRLVVERLPVGVSVGIVAKVGTGPGLVLECAAKTL
jgi:hypothetical protein